MDAPSRLPPGLTDMLARLDPDRQMEQLKRDMAKFETLDKPIGRALERTTEALARELARIEAAQHATRNAVESAKEPPWLRWTMLGLAAVAALGGGLAGAAALGWIP